MPDWCDNILEIKIPEVRESDHQTHLHFKDLREFLGGTLIHNTGWLCPMPDTKVDLAELRRQVLAEGEMTTSDEVINGVATDLKLWSHKLGCGELFLGWGFSIEELGTSGVTLTFRTKWSPPSGWVGAIHDRFPEWKLSLSFNSAEGSYSGHLTWDGEKWCEGCHRSCPSCGGAEHDNACPV